MPDLQVLEKEIRDYSNSKVIKILCGESLKDADFDLNSYNDLIDLADNFVIFEAIKFDEDYFSIEEGGTIDTDELKGLRNKYSKYLGKTCQLMLYYKKDNIILRYIQTADWYTDFGTLKDEATDKEDDENDNENEEDNDLLDNIPEEDLCKRCKKDRRVHNDKDYCFNCVAELTEQAKKTSESIKEELFKDKLFLKITSSDMTKAYIKDKYKNSKEENKFIYLDALAKHVYNLKKIKNL